MADGRGDVDDAHSKVRNALDGLKNIPIGSLNQTEREYAVDALQDIRDLDEALAQRSEQPAEPLGMTVTSDEEMAGDAEEVDA